MRFLMRFVNKGFYIENGDYYRLFVVNLFKRATSREIIGFNDVLNSFRVLDIE